MSHREITYLGTAIQLDSCLDWNDKVPAKYLQTRPRVGGIHWCALHQRFARVSCTCIWVPFHVEYSDYDCPGDDPWIEAAEKQVPQDAYATNGWLDNQ